MYIFAHKKQQFVLHFPSALFVIKTLHLRALKVPNSFKHQPNKQMELISTQRMSYESWLHTWNLEDDDDDFSSSDGESNTKEGEERSATLKDLRTVQRRECSTEEEINGQCCAICLSRFTKKREEKSDDDGNEQTVVVQRKCFRLAELPCKHVYHEECIESWLARSRRCPTCRKSLREKKKKTGTQAKNGSEERLLSRPNEDVNDDEEEDDDARAQSRRELERESVRRLREMETRARERRAREVEEERRARRRNRMKTVLEHEGMNEEIFESVMMHAMGLLEAATVAGEEDREDVGEEEEEEEEEEEQRLPRARVANQTGAGSLLVGTRGNNYGANGSNTS